MAIVGRACGWGVGPYAGGYGGAGDSGELGNVFGFAGFTYTDAAAIAARSGPYGLRCHPTAYVAGQAAGYNQSGVYVARLYFKYPVSLPAADTHIAFFGQDAGLEKNGVQWRFRQSDSKLIAVSLDNTGAVTATAVGLTLSADTWYRLEFRHNADGTIDSQIATGDGAATALTQLTGGVAYDALHLGNKYTNQTYDLYFDDLCVIYATAGGDNAAVSAMYPFGPGYVRDLKPTSLTSNDSSKFSASSGLLADAWQLLDDRPMFGAGSIQQDTSSGTAYCELGFQQLAVNEIPRAVTIPLETRGGSSAAELRRVKDGVETTHFSGSWNAVQIVGTGTDTGEWTRAQVNGAAVRFGFGASISSAPIFGGVGLMVDVSLVDPPVVGPVFDVQRSVASAKGWRKVPDVHFSIDEIHVDQEEDWVLRSSAFGGYIDGSFKIPGRQAKRHPLSIDAGAPVVAYTQALDQIWEGEVAHAPRIGEDGLAELETTGPWHQAEAAGEVLVFQERGGRRWAEGDEDPHNFAQNDAYELTQRGGKLQFKAPKGEDFTAGNLASFALWIPGAHFTRVAFVLNKSGNDGNFELKLRGGTGPSGALTDIDTWGLGSGGPASGSELIKTPLGGDYDLLAFTIRCATGVSNLATRLRVWLTQIRVNDRADDDDWSCSDVVIDVGDQLGWNTDGVESTGANVLPLVWEEPWSELLLYMADLEDHFVRRVAGGLQYGPFADQEWEVLRSFSGRPDLRQLDPYNRAVVRYTTMSGKPAEITVDADPDPLPGEIRVIDYELEDPQPNDLLATAMCERMIAKYSKLRWAGFIDVWKARHRSGPLAILPGDGARILDWDQGEDLLLPIHGIEQRRDRARLSIESPISLVALLEEARRGLGHPRRRGKNRRRNG